MKSNVKKNSGKKAFTIVELLTVISVMVVLISILVPALNKVRQYAKEVKQRAQFHSIGIAIDMFNAENDEYPPSEMTTLNGKQYCGAQKLAEAMIGQDKLGFHPDSRFYENGTIDGGTGVDLYPNNPSLDNLKSRKDNLDVTNANAYKLGDIYRPTDISGAGFHGDKFVLCDVYSNVNNLDTTGQAKSKIGMPILYYRANTSKFDHIWNNLNPNDNIYNYEDNDELVKLGIPWETGAEHPMASNQTTTIDGQVRSGAWIFYNSIQDDQIITPLRPKNSKSYILMSAGYDGEYGTRDDIFNF